MKVNFFEHELTKLRNRFKETYGRMIVYSVSNRDWTILTLVGMGVAERRINSTKDKNEVRGDIRQFVKTKNYLNDHFDKLEEIIERRLYVEQAKRRDSEQHSKAV